jgi:hypothetical protein
MSMDKINRQAAWLATVISLPITALVIGSAFYAARKDDPVAQPAASAPLVRPYPSTPVPVKLPRLTGQASRVCPALVYQLPRALDGLPQRPVAAGSTQAAAYGEPAITVVCGTPMPKIGQTDVLFRLNGVCWHSIDQESVTIWTTADREVPVQMMVPREYQQPMTHTSHQAVTGEAAGSVVFLAEYGKWAIALSDAIISAVPSRRQIPSGCNN